MVKQTNNTGQAANETLQNQGQKRNTKAVSLSTRISQEDAEFLSSLQIQGANTPSEKLRVLITDTRKRHDGEQDFRSSLLMFQEMLNRVSSVCRQLEMENQVHSEIVSRLTEWLPDMMAFMTTMGAELQQSATIDNSSIETSSIDALKKLEDGLTDRSFRLFQSILQMGVTDSCPCYQGDAVAKHLTPIVNLVNVIQK